MPLVIAAGPPGTPAPMSLRHMQDRALEEGDVVHMLVETNGPGGHYAELGRSCVIGEAPAEAVEELAFALAAQRFSVSLLEPGKLASDVWRAYNDYMREHGRPPEQRLHSHGQGYDMVERPLVRSDEPFAIAAGMNFAVHPSYMSAAGLTFVCDNYLIGEAGASDRLHSTPQELREI